MVVFGKLSDKLQKAKVGFKGNIVCITNGVLGNYKLDNKLSKCEKNNWWDKEDKQMNLLSFLEKEMKKSYLLKEGHNFEFITEIKSFHFQPNYIENIEAKSKYEHIWFLGKVFRIIVWTYIMYQGSLWQTYNHLVVTNHQTGCVHNT